jgi:membrane associated rhomboid family serine protease
VYNLELRFNKKHRATYVIVALTTLVWLVQFFTYGAQVGSGQNLFNAGALWGNWILIRPEDLWRLFTPIFLHLSWTHFFLNMFTLLLVGRVIEEIFGSLRFSVIYFLSGVFANAATFFFSTTSLSVGASTAIFGIFGAIATLGYFTGDPRLKEIGKGFIILIVFNLVVNFFQSGVNVVGHIGGVAGGALLAAVFPPSLYRKWIPSYVRWLSLVVIVVLFALFIVLPFMKG